LAKDEFKSISESLKNAGFPNLPPMTLTTDGTVNLSKPQVQSLKTTVDSLLGEYGRRGQMIQSLIERVNAAEAQATQTPDTPVIFPIILMIIDD
jgi:hypothetical protein